MSSSVHFYNDRGPKSRQFYTRVRQAKDVAKICCLAKTRSRFYNINTEFILRSAPLPATAVQIWRHCPFGYRFPTPYIGLTRSQFDKG